MLFPSLPFLFLFAGSGILLWFLIRYISWNVPFPCQLNRFNIFHFPIFWISFRSKIITRNYSNDLPMTYRTCSSFTVCNFIVHERCVTSVVTPCSGIAPSIIKNPVAHCWSEPSQNKRKFCTVCRKRFDETPAVHCMSKNHFKMPSRPCISSPKLLYTTLPLQYASTLLT